MFTSSAPTLSRAAIVAYSHPAIYISVSYLIPSPAQSINILSATKPFDTWVSIIVLNIYFFDNLNKKVPPHFKNI